MFAGESLDTLLLPVVDVLGRKSLLSSVSPTPYMCNSSLSCFNTKTYVVFLLHVNLAR